MSSDGRARSGAARRRRAVLAVLLRRARRLATRSPLRSAATGLLIVFAVAVGVVALSVSRGSWNAVAPVERAFGRADVVYVGGASQVTEVPRAIAALRSVLPTGSRVAVTQTAQGLTFRGPDGDRSGDAVMADWSDPLLGGVLHVVAGRAPRAGEVVVTPRLAEGAGVGLGDRLDVIGSERPLRVVGIAGIGNSPTYSVAAGPGAFVPAPSSTEPVGVEMRSFVALPDGAAAPPAESVPGAGGDPGFVLGGPSGRDPSMRTSTDFYAVVTASTVPLGLTVVVLAGVLAVLGVLAGAAFGIGAARRSRANGLLAASGADEAQLALAAASEAVVVALPAALAGLVLARVVPLGWVRFRLPHWSSVVQASLPWTWAVLAVVAAVGAAAVGAVLFSRSARRRPTSELLDGRAQRISPAQRRQRLSGLAWLGVGMFGWVVLYAVGVSAFRWLGVVAAVAMLVLWSVCVFGAMRLVGLVLDRDAVGRLVRRDLDRRRVASTAVIAVVSTWVFVAVTGAAGGGFALWEVRGQPDEFTYAVGEATTTVPAVPTTVPAVPTTTVAVGRPPAFPPVTPPAAPGTAVVLQPVAAAGGPDSGARPAGAWMVRGSEPSPPRSPGAGPGIRSARSVSTELASAGLVTSTVTVGNWTGPCSVCPKGFTPTVMVLDRVDGLGLAPATADLLRSGVVVTPFSVVGIESEQVSGLAVRVGALPSGISATVLGSSVPGGLHLTDEHAALIGDASGLDPRRLGDVVGVVQRAGWMLSSSEPKLAGAWGQSQTIGSESLRFGAEWNAWPWLALLVAVSLVVTATHRREHGDAARVLHLLGAGPRAGRRLASLTAGTLTGVGVALGLTASFAVLAVASTTTAGGTDVWNRQTAMLVVVSIVVPVVVAALAMLIPPYRSLDGPDGPMPA